MVSSYSFHSCFCFESVFLQLFKKNPWALGCSQIKYVNILRDKNGEKQDGTCAFVLLKAWVNCFLFSPPLRALVFIAHGAGEHSGPYDEIAQRLKERSLLVFAHDHGEWTHTHTWRDMTLHKYICVFASRCCLRLQIKKTPFVFLPSHHGAR